MDRDVLANLADACRRGLGGLAECQGSMFRGFPVAACGPASELVGRLLKERLGLDGFYVCGTAHPGLRDGQSHAWFEVGGNIIDITYDQFPGVNLGSWLLSQDSPWHRSFGNIERRYGFCTPSGWPQYPFDGYRAIQNILDTKV
ncbi:MAG: hypothetical protein EOP24_27895 [Hyphomicrobiales bacterium]|nr:MAG: hypothetical protein EOP24_27895 [Hyphomicrobiales bacterium]